MGLPEAVVHAAASAYAVLGALFAVPQLLRLARTRQTDGLSLPGWVNGCLSYAAWLVYLASEGAWPLFAGTVVAFAPWGAVTVAIARWGAKVPIREWFPVLAWGAALGGALTVSYAGQPEVFGAVLAFSALWSYGPSLVQAWRSADVSGLSPLTWCLSMAEGVASSVAGWGLWPAMTYGVSATALSLGVVVRIVRGRSAKTETAVNAQGS